MLQYVFSFVHFCLLLFATVALQKLCYTMMSESGTKTMNG